MEIKPIGLTLEEVAFALGTDAATVKKMMKERDMPCMKIGKAWRFSREAVDRWLGSGRYEDLKRSDAGIKRGGRQSSEDE